jgi:glutathione synthase/RimK-type ligase-like ATP-grasp enzyme
VQDPGATRGPVALATAHAAIGFDADMPLLSAALLDRGVDHQAVVWDDPSIDWSSFSLVVLRSTWDYTTRIAKFLTWIDRVAATTTLANSSAVVHWNTDKHYLREVEAAGLPIVPTVFVEAGDANESASEWSARLDEWLAIGDVVVKPCISAGSNDTSRHADRPSALAHIMSLTGSGRSTMIQPYLADVERTSETGLVYLGGTLSHAFAKGPLLASERDMEAGLYAREQISSRQPTDAERHLGDRAVAWLTERFGELLYARVDLLPSADGPVIIELELTEPSLFLQTAEGASARAAHVIADRLG